MSAAAIAAVISVVENLLALIPQWIAQAKARGELTSEQEADFQTRCNGVFAQPYAQPEPEQPS